MLPVDSPARDSASALYGFQTSPRPGRARGTRNTSDARASRTATIAVAVTMAVAAPVARALPIRSATAERVALPNALSPPALRAVGPGPTTAATCPANTQCLSSGSCANVCVTPTDCPMFNCACATSVEGLRHCVDGSSLNCGAITHGCTTTADCPVGASCVERPCGLGGSAQRGCILLSQCGS
jgi:hypothetical protein